MQIIKEILGIIVSWPTVGIIAIFLFRKPIFHLLDRFAKSKYAKAKVGSSGVEIEMERTIDEEDQKVLPSSGVDKPVHPEDTEIAPSEGKEKKSLQSVLNLLFEKKDYREAQKVFFEEVKAQLTEDGKLLWEAYILRHSRTLGDTDALHKLEEMEKQNPGKPEVIKQLAHLYREMEEFEEAKKKFLLAKDLYNIEDKDQINSIVDCYVQASQCLASDNQYDSAVDMLKQILRKNEFKDQYAEILHAMAYIAKDKGLLEDFTFYAEASLIAKHLNTELRFDLAYIYSDMGRGKLALLHYKKLIDITPQAMALNNLGVCYSHLKLKAKAITNYLKSAEHNETLAMGNIAYSYLDAGFLNDAKKVIEEANKLSSQGIDVNPRIGVSKQRLKNMQKEEEETENKLLDEAKKEKEFRLKYAQSRLSDKTTSENAWEGPWETPWGEVKIELDKNLNSFQIKLHTKEVDHLATAFGRSFVSPFGLLQPQQVYKERNIIVDGGINGLTGKYKIQIDDANGPPPTLLTAGKVYSATGYMIIDESCDRIEIMEKTTDDNTNFKEWKKVGSK
jgi:tetratricopeptide (TPR) repeat protein